MKSRVILIGFLILTATLASADEIVLKSGKTLTGRITSETDQSYTIKLGANMFISVTKDEVSHVNIPKPQTPARPVYRMTPPTDVTSGPAASGAKPAAKPSAVTNPRENISTETLKVGRVAIRKATIFKVYTVDGANFAAAEKAIRDPDDGKGFPDGRRRRPSQTEWKATWSGQAGDGGREWKSMVVVATITVTLPAWNAKDTVSKADGEKWASLVKKATEHETGHLEIIHDALVSFAESAGNLTGLDEGDLKAETTSLFAAIQQQTAKRRQGYERRERRAPLPIRKKLK